MNTGVYCKLYKIIYKLNWSEDLNNPRPDHRKRETKNLVFVLDCI